MDVVQRKKPGPAPRISRRDVVEVARRLQAEDNLTMTAISEELGVSVAALYRYVPDKAAVVGLLTLEDRDALDLPDASLPWRAWLEAVVRDARDFWNSHPEMQSVAGLAGTARPPQRALEVGMEILIQKGFDPLNAMAAITAASQLGFSLSMLDRLREDYPDPELSAAMREFRASYGIEGGWEELSEEIITMLLDGIATRVPEGRRATP